MPRLHSARRQYGCAQGRVQISVIGEARFMLVAEKDDITGIAPLRIGVAWRF